jgi:hypothetical protein
MDDMLGTSWRTRTPEQSAAKPVNKLLARGFASMRPGEFTLRTMGSTGLCGWMT